ncbi:MAG: MBL fold metallo-hydrolase [Pseudonocardiales bacterium]
MKLTVVGCAGSFARADAACSAYLVEAEGFRLMLDMGNGALGALQQHIGLYDLDALYISHLHGDHFFDACSYVVARRYGPQGLQPVLPLFAPRGTLARFARACEINPQEARLGEVYDERVLAAATFEIGPFRVTTGRMNHPVETYGVRLEHGGRVLAYSADSAPTEALTALARDADVFLCEATWSSAVANPPGLHVTGAEAGQHAEEAGVAQLLLTHLTSWTDHNRILDEAAGTFGGKVAVVASGDSYDV